MVVYASLLLPFILVPSILFLSVLVLKKRNKQGNGRPNFPPSPPKLPLIGNLHQLGDLPHRSLAKLSKEYGPIMLIQLGLKPTLVVSSMETAREVLKANDLDFASRPSLVGPKRLSYNFLDFAFGPYSEYWKEMRKICTMELFNSKRAQSFGAGREEEVADLMKYISGSLSSPINLTEKLFSLTTRIISRVAFGKSIKATDFNSSEFDEIVKEAMGMLSSFTATDFFPYFGWIIDVFTGLNTRLEKCFNTLDTFYNQVIDEHLDPKRPKPEHEDIIDAMLGLEHDQFKATRQTNNHVKAVLMNIFLGGVETSAITMIWAMTELIRNPAAMKKVQEEIRNCVGNKGKVEESDIYQLHYLKMVIKEVLRLHPTSPLLLPRESRNYCKINGYDIYPKTRTFVNVWAIGRNSEYWENPDEFIPERFVNSPRDFKGQDFEFLPFGSGRRMCPAMNMGLAIVELGLANLLYCFNWEVPTGMTKEDIDVEEVINLTVHKKNPLNLVPIKYNC